MSLLDEIVARARKQVGKEIVKEISNDFESRFRRPAPTERRLDDVSRETVLKHVDWLERNFSILRRGNRRLPEVKVFKNEIELLFDNVGGDLSQFKLALTDGHLPSGTYNMMDNRLSLAEGVPEHVFVHELAHYLQPAGMTERECEKLAGEAQLAWAKEFAPGDVRFVQRVVKLNVENADKKRIHSFRHDSDFLPDGMDEKIRREFQRNQRKVVTT